MNSSKKYEALTQTKKTRCFPTNCTKTHFKCKKHNARSAQKKNNSPPTAAV